MAEVMLCVQVDVKTSFLSHVTRALFFFYIFEVPSLWFVAHLWKAQLVAL